MIFQFTAIVLLIVNVFFLNFKLPAVNLDQIRKYAESTEEFPKPDGLNWQKPDYTSFYKKRTTGLFHLFFEKLFHIAPMKKVLSTDEFIYVLKKVTKERIARGLVAGDFVEKISLKQRHNYVIWSDLQASFHSFVRSLSELEKQGILNNDLEIIKSDYSFLFNGNVLGRSPYILETFTVLLYLMEKNPERVVFIKGQQEIEDNWKNFGLKNELKFKCKSFFKKKLPFEIEIQKFLDTLPRAVYIQSQDGNIIKISYFATDYEDLQESKFSDFFKKKKFKAVDFFFLKSMQEQAPEEVKIGTIISGLNRTVVYQKTDGLSPLISEKAIPAWSIFSCQNDSCRKLYKFYNDAFAILSVEKNINYSLITLYKQDTLKKDGFKSVGYKLISQQSLSGITKPQDSKLESETLKRAAGDDQILIGTTLDLSAGLSEVARYILNGLRLKIESQNKKGGIKGKKITLIHLDDKYDPQRAKKNVKTLMNLGVDILLTPVGSMTLRSYLSLVEKKKLLVLFPEATTPVYRTRTLKNIVHFLASSEREGEILTDYVINDLGIKKIAFFYQPEPFSEGALNGANKALFRSKLVHKEDWISTYHLPNSIDASRAAKKIKKFNPQAIILLTTSLAVENLINKLGISFIFGKTIAGISACSGVAFKSFLRYKSLKFINTQLVPDPQTSHLEIVREFRETARQKGEPLSVFTLEGYIAASLFVDIAKKVKGPITKEAILEVIEKIKNYNFNGLTLNFNPETRELLNYVWVDVGDGEMILKK